MKRGALQKSNIVSMREKYPYNNSPQSLTLENEIKRIAAERGESIEQTIRLLANFSGISERQIYNYRTGKCDIPSSHIPMFCRHFKSNALAMTILQQCDEREPLEAFDIIRVGNQSARLTLQAHDSYFKAFDDGVIDGFELNELKKATAASVASFNQLEEIAEASYQRRTA